MERLLKLSNEINTLNHTIEEGKRAERQREDLIVEYENHILKEAERILEEREMAENTVSEICPWCEREVILKNKFETQKCPNCGKEIKLCAMCKNYKEEI